MSQAGIGLKGFPTDLQDAGRPGLGDGVTPPVSWGSRESRNLRRVQRPQSGKRAAERGSYASLRRRVMQSEPWRPPPVRVWHWVA